MSRFSMPLAAALVLSLAACSAAPSQGEKAKNTQMSEDPAAPTSSTPPPSQGVRARNTQMSQDPAAPLPQSSSMAPPSDASTPAAMLCDAGKALAAIGKVATQAVVDKVVADSGSRSARVIKPGMAVTMDFREDRVNIDVDAANKITAIRCG